MSCAKPPSTRTFSISPNSSPRFGDAQKGGKLHELQLDDPKLARILQSCPDVPGQRLFQYLEPDGRHAAVTSGDVNDYLREVTGEAFSAKDFRTWAGTLLALHALAATEGCSSASDARSGSNRRWSRSRVNWATP